MTTYNEGDELYYTAKNKLKWIFVPFDNIKYKGLENKIEQGPNLIVANHPGIARDIACIVKAYERRLFFTPIKELFDKEELNALIDKEFYARTSGLGETTKKALFKLHKPARDRFSGYISEMMNKLEMIPFDKQNNGNRREMVSCLRESIDKIKLYLTKDRAVVIFQTDSNMIKNLNHNRSEEESKKERSRHHDYLYKFNTTAARIAFEVYNETGLAVPITPIGLYNAEGLNPFKRIRINIGEPTNVLPYIDDKNKLINLTDDLEKRVTYLLTESGVPAFSSLSVR